MIADASFHRWRNSERLMDSRKVVVDEEDSEHVFVIRQLLREGVR